jgi:methyl-accepting chemotaxis protein
MDVPMEEPPASNGISHESAELPNEHSEDLFSEHSKDGGKDLSQEMDATVKKMKDVQQKMRDIKDDVAAMKESLENIWETIDRMKQLVISKPYDPDDPDETSTQAH